MSASSTHVIDINKSMVIPQHRIPTATKFSMRACHITYLPARTRTVETPVRNTCLRSSSGSVSAGFQGSILQEMQCKMIGSGGTGLPNRQGRDAGPKPINDDQTSRSDAA